MTERTHTIQFQDSAFESVHLSDDGVLTITATTEQLENVDDSIQLRLEQAAKMKELKKNPD